MSEATAVAVAGRIPGTRCNVNLHDDNEEEIPFVFDADPDFTDCENGMLPVDSDMQSLDQAPIAFPVNDPRVTTSDSPITEENTLESAQSDRVAMDYDLQGAQALSGTGHAQHALTIDANGSPGSTPRERLGEWLIRDLQKEVAGLRAVVSSQEATLRNDQGIQIALLKAAQLLNEVQLLNEENRRLKAFHSGMTFPLALDARTGASVPRRPSSDSPTLIPAHVGNTVEPASAAEKKAGDRNADPREKQRFWNKCLRKMGEQDRDCGAAVSIYYERFHAYPNDLRYSPEPSQLDIPVRVLVPHWQIL